MEMCKLPLVDGGKLQIVALLGFSRKPPAQKWPEGPGSGR